MVTDIGGSGVETDGVVGCVSWCKLIRLIKGPNLSKSVYGLVTFLLRIIKRLNDIRRSFSVLLVLIINFYKKVNIMKKNLL